MNVTATSQQSNQGTESAGISVVLYTVAMTAPLVSNVAFRRARDDSSY